ncbi:universal stress protein [Modestobacter italicus]|uniref:universal stress protein n=1 Tax=Modestobacter italicus (strain DSM 44449 / CECT 9708 / BC 501) TaxID=2732864 RepID=UPI001C938324|nr:universal stress protein [Modestobacter italicus]
MTVLVGFVPTPEGEAAFTAGLAEARRRGEDLLVLNSPRGGAPVSADVAPPELVVALTARAQADGVPLELRQTPHTGDLADAVLRVAEEADASVIVIGLRRRSPVGKLLMGSSAQRILLDADRPVLAVKPQHG